MCIRDSPIGIGMAHNFKQLALLGMAGGLLIASQTPVQAEVMTDSEVILAGQNGCSSCGSKPPQRKHIQPDQMLSESDTQLMKDTSRKQIVDSPNAMKESDLLPQLSENSKTTYQTLDVEGKAAALKLAAEQNPNEAVKVAAKQMAERQAKPAPNAVK